MNRRLAKEGPHAEGGSQYWRFEGENVPLLLAWHLPAGFVPTGSAPLDAPLEADPPQEAGVSSGGNALPAPDWSALATPGQADARSLVRGGYVPLCLAVAAVPPASPSAPADDGEGLVYVPPPSPRRDLKTVTLIIFVREQQEVRPFHLLVPVGASFPPGWDPDTADGRSSAP